MRPFRLLAILAGAASLLPGQNRTPIENERVKVILATSEPHRKTALHEHRVNRVMIYLDAGEQVITYEGGRVVRTSWKAGDALWSPGGGKHVAENVGAKPFRIVEIELKGSGGGPLPSSALDPVKVDRKHYTVVFENPQVRVVRARYGPREKGVLHEHSGDRVVVFLTDQHMRVTPDGGAPEEARAKADEVRWLGKAKHSEENLSDRVFEVLVVELKNNN